MISRSVGISQQGFQIGFMHQQGLRIARINVITTSPFADAIRFPSLVTAPKNPVVGVLNAMGRCGKGCGIYINVCRNDVIG